MFRRVNRFSIEMVVNSGMFIIVLMSNMYFIGKMKDTQLTTGVGMGGTIFMLFGTNVQQGLNCALETFISQSFGASQDETKSLSYRQQMRVNCGVYYNRGRIVSSLAVVPIALIFINTEKWLLACF